MSYLFWLRDEPHRVRLAGVLAEMLSLPADAVDVGTTEDEDRNWEAAVLCTVTAIGGDLRLHLDVYVADEVPGQPSPEAAAAWLAERLETVVAYQALPIPPDAFWIVGPDGERTRARIDDEPDENDVSRYRIDAVEHPVAAMPGPAVAAVPEVIRHYRLPTPLAEGLRSRLDPPPATGSAAWHAVTHLAVWEGMVARLLAGWHPDGWYPPEFYREDLETRDRLVDASATLPDAVRVEFEEVLATVDKRFAEVTEDDGGRALASATGPVPDRWWWHRVTRPLPWHSMPGR
ncbi:hypothetical protein Ait01nite_074500 [Actinoplanes italicus]|uniref:DinB family protein n=1 Tax=Actinoplanes italicus TaxID=113567 RepID=A0A2T0K0M7_9ACTN|nr:hypothetical protein [Actinoplanes italicus]PRX16328.1 hypothetical protein CLV67_120143 [Actinoplanes italicus]GIE34405.1 hypothetical protein Ait01nite_074500 [Actinoplanes italicus]